MGRTRPVGGGLPVCFVDKRDHKGDARAGAASAAERRSVRWPPSSRVLVCQEALASAARPGRDSGSVQRHVPCVVCRSKLYYPPEIVKEINDRMSALSGVMCQIDVTADSGSTVASHVYAAISQGARLRTGLSEAQRASIKPTACKLMILSHDQWVSSTGRLQLYSCARRNDFPQKVELVRKAVRSIFAGVFFSYVGGKASDTPAHPPLVMARSGGTLLVVRIRVYQTSSGWMPRCSASPPAGGPRPRRQPSRPTLRVKPTWPSSWRSSRRRCAATVDASSPSPAMLASPTACLRDRLPS